MLEDWRHLVVIRTLVLDPSEMTVVDGRAEGRVVMLHCQIWVWSCDVAGCLSA